MKPAISKKTITWVPTAYFGMGLPYVALSLVSVIMFADLGVDAAKITFWTSLLILPYTLKPLWSPLLELYFTKKGFVLAMEALCGIGFGLIAFMLPVSDPFMLIIGIMWLISICGATNDIATDGIYITALDKETQAKYIGWQGAFYNLAKVIANGGLVYLAGWLITRFAGEGNMAPVKAWMVIMGIIALLLIGLAIYHYFFLPIGSRNEDTPDTFVAAMRSTFDVFKDFFTKRYIWLYILFIICYRLTEGFAVKMVPLFLKAPLADGGLGLSNETIGVVYGTFGTISFIIGSILSGYFIAHFGLKKVLLILVAIFNIPFAIYYLFATYQPTDIMTIAIGLTGEYFCYGFGFVGLTLFMMQQVAPGKHPMAHYAFASGIMNLGFMIPGMISGWVFKQVGYETFFLVALFMCIPAFLLALFIPFAHTSGKIDSEKN